MEKVQTNSTVKLDGKFVPPGKYEVSAEKKKELDKKGLLGEIKKSNKPTNQKEIDELVAKVADLEDENRKLKAELVKAELVKAELVKAKK